MCIVRKACYHCIRGVRYTNSTAYIQDRGAWHATVHGVTESEMTSGLNNKKQCIGCNCKGVLRWLTLGGTQWLEIKVGGLLFVSPLHVWILNHVTALTNKKIFKLLKSGLPLCGSAGKESTYNAGDLGSIPGVGRSPGEGKGYPLQYSGLENSMDFIVRGVAKSRTWLGNFDFHFKLLYLSIPVTNFH